MLLGVRGIGSIFMERKQAEAIITKQNVQLQKLNADKDRFLSILAHDLRSPFNAILGFLSLLIENVRRYDTDKIENQLHFIENSAQRVYNLLEDILLWVKVQSGKLPYEPQSQDFTEICTDVIEFLQQNAIKKNIAVKYLEIEKINVFADINMLKTTLRNLISNAIKFTNPGGKVNIYAEQTPINLTVTVADDGIGIAPEIIDKIFDVSQTYTSKGTANETGTGLGLLLCKEFVEKHGGKIWVESEIGKGSLFIFTLPTNLMA